jgi:hypothetical protein
MEHVSSFVSIHQQDRSYVLIPHQNARFLIAPRGVRIRVPAQNVQIGNCFERFLRHL